MSPENLAQFIFVLFGYVPVFNSHSRNLANKGFCEISMERPTKLIDNIMFSGERLNLFLNEISGILDSGH